MTIHKRLLQSIPMKATESLRREIKLSGKWHLTWSTPDRSINSLSDLHPDGVRWIPATVPGEVHFDILGKETAERLFNSYLSLGDRHEIFDKAFLAEHNWIAETDFWYRKTFDIEVDTLSDDIELIFEGIDYFAAIWLNGQEIGETHNALAWHAFKIAPQLLKSRNNELIVKIKSTKCALMDNTDVKLDYKYIGPNLGHFVTRCLRKPIGSFFFGFKEAFLTPTGIWREVRLLSHPKSKIEDVWTKTRMLELDSHRMAKAGLEIEITLAGHVKMEELNVSVVLLDKEGRSIFEATAKPEKTTMTLKKTLEQIRPWYPHNVGEPYLYTLKVVLTHAGAVLDSYQATIGFRSIELVLEEGNENRFYFRVNNEKVVLKGALLTLMDYFLFRETESKYKEVLEKMYKANMNMVCPLGAEAYYTRAFYDICDHLGIMILATFPFVWGINDWVSMSPHLVEDLKDEVEKHLKAVRNHASIICFIGSCECYGYNDINWNVLRNACRNLSPHTPYVPSHPWSPPGTIGKNDIDWIRNNHGYEYYAGGRDPDFNPTILEWISPASGVSEGFVDNSLMSLSCSNAVSFPTMKTIRETWSEEISGELMRSFLAGKINCETVFPREKILPPFMSDRLDLAKIEDVVLLSQLFAGHRIKTDIESLRRRKECGGGGFCSFNPLVPGVWHGAVDYYLRPKAPYYFAKRAYENLIIMVYGKPIPGSVGFHGGYHFSAFLVQGEPRKEVWIVNDYRKAYSGKFVVAQYSFDGKERWKEEKEITVPPASTNKVFEFTLNEEMLERRRTDFVLARFISDGGLQSSNKCFIGELRELALPQAKLNVQKAKVEDSGEYGCFALDISADKYAGIVRVGRVDGDMDDFVVSDNYFDICPNETVRVEVKMATPGKLWVEALNCERTCV